MEKRFVFTTKFRITVIIFMLIGVASLVAILIDSGPGKLLWSRILLNNYFFLAIALSGVFFIVVHALGESGWQTSIQRIPEAMGTFIPVAGFLMLIMIVFGSHDLYQWTHKGHLDAVLEAKKNYLNMPFFIVRFAIYFAGWIILSNLMRRQSLLQDTDPDLIHYKKHRIFSGLFIVFFAVTVSTSSWDWLMSIDAHWYSTLYGWYVFSGLLVSGVAMIILLVLILKASGYMKHVNKEHLHDLGKYLFAFSILWAYLWFSQYALIWYGNLPEETVYYVQRLSGYKYLFFLNFIINFGAPFLILMTRNSKRTPWIMAIAAIVVLAGHWIDYYLAIMPGIMHAKPAITISDAGLTLGYLGIFLYFTFSALAKANLVPANHPFFKESLEYHTNY